MKSLLALVALGMASPAMAGESVQRFALVVGANHGGSERAVLRYAESDAESFVDVMSDLGGLHPQNIVMLREPTRADFMQALQDLEQLVESKGGDARSEVIVYYSGHSDEQGLLLYGDRVRYKELRDGLDAIDTDVRIAVVDSCSSGALIRAKGGSVAPPFLVDEASGVSGHAYLTSSSADESAQEADRILGSYFTHFLVSGLRGAADATGDGRVTLSEAYHFAYNETLQQTESTRFGPQHAAHDIHLSGTGDLVLTDLSVVDAGLIFSEALDGRLFVRDHKGRLVAELLKVPGRAVELGLGAGRYKIRLQREDGVFEARVTVNRGQRMELSQSDFSVIEQIATTARGGDPPSDTELKRRPVVGQLAGWPGGPGSDVRTNLALGLGSTYVGQLHGAALSFGYNGADRGDRGSQITLGANMSRADWRGSQFSIGGNWVQRDMQGVQATVGGNLAGGRMRGLQASVGGNVAGRDVHGTQISVGTNVAAGAVQGAQLTVGLNAAGGPLRGLQVAVGGNVAPAASRGAQLSSGINYAGNGFDGAQIGLVNIGGDIHGAQIGVINIARRVRGSQIGVINISKSVDGGIPLGLLNVVEKGQFHAEVWASDVYVVGGGMQFGSKHFFTTVQAGYAPDHQTVFTGLGFGVHIPADPVWFEVEVISGPPIEGLKEPTSIHSMLRASAGWKVKQHFSPMVGAQLNGVHSWRDDGPALDGLLLPDGVPADSRLAVWPSFFAGVQF